MNQEPSTIETATHLKMHSDQPYLKLLRADANNTGLLFAVQSSLPLLFLGVIWRSSLNHLEDMNL